MTVRQIVILNDHASLRGGASTVAIASALGLAACGLSVLYFSCVGPVAPELVGVPNLTVVCLGQAELVRMPSRLRAAGRGLHNRAAVRALRQLLHDRDPADTVVHAHSWHQALSPGALHAVTTLGFPLVVTLHDFFIACPNGGFFEHPAGLVCRRRPLSPSCLTCHCDRRSHAQKLWRSVRTFLQNRLLGLPRQVDHFIAVSAFSLDLLRPYLPPRTAVSVVQHPINARDEGPARVEHNATFVFIGRLVPEKGVRLFAEAVGATNRPAVFVGAGELLPDLCERCPGARFTGWLSPTGIRAELRQARALVFPSLWYETLGLVTIEAAAAGVPSIVADGCAATDWVRHGENGVHFTHGSASSLAIRMQELANDDTLVRRLGAAAYRQYWQEPWTRERHVTRLLEIYASLRRREVAA